MHCYASPPRTRTPEAKEHGERLPSQPSSHQPNRFHISDPADLASALDAFYRPEPRAVTVAQRPRQGKEVGVAMRVFWGFWGVFFAILLS